MKLPQACATRVNPDVLLVNEFDFDGAGTRAPRTSTTIRGVGGLASGLLFVIAGDYNADPNDGDAFQDPIEKLLQHPLVNVSGTPASQGGILAAVDTNNNGNATHLTHPKFDTADFNDAAPGNLRVDYVLPWRNVQIIGSGIFWPLEGTADRPLVGEFNTPGLFPGLPSSDHKAVFVDVTIPQPVPVPAALPLLGAALLGLRLLSRRADARGV